MEEVSEIKRLEEALVLSLELNTLLTNYIDQLVRSKTDSSCTSSDTRFEKDQNKIKRLRKLLNKKVEIIFLLPDTKLESESSRDASQLREHPSEKVTFDPEDSMKDFGDYEDSSRSNDYGSQEDSEEEDMSILETIDPGHAPQIPLDPPPLRNNDLATVTSSQPTNTPEDYPCSICGYVYKTQQSLQIHSRVHKSKDLSSGKPPRGKGRKKPVQNPPKGQDTLNEIRCEICVKTFKEIASLKRHMRSHLNQKDYMCDVCGASFTRKDHLLLHERKHTNERPYRCSFEGCSAAFHRSGALVQHRSVHDKDKRYLCHLCPKAYGALPNLREHVRSHAGIYRKSRMDAKKRNNLNFDISQS